MLIETLSTFPEMFNSVMGTSMMAQAQKKGLLEFCPYDLRDWTHDLHRTTDDAPYGGGGGLLMKCEPIFEAWQAITGISAGYNPGPLTGREQPKTGPAPRYNSTQDNRPKTIFLTPTGQPFNDALACSLAKEPRLLFVCGHYEGIDERAYDLSDLEISLGDFVLTSGELAALVVIDAVVRKIPGVLGAVGGADSESFAAQATGLLEHPQFTRPATFMDKSVPEVLLSGNHQAVAQWQRHASLWRTAQRRPDLLDNTFWNAASKEDKKFLETLGIYPPNP